MSTIGAPLVARMARIEVSDLEADESLSDISALLEGINAAIQFSAYIAYAADETLDDGLDQIPSLIKVRYIHYGSPLEIVVDLEPLARILSENGYLLLLAALGGLLGKFTAAWENIENARKAREERRELKRARKEMGRQRVAGGLLGELGPDQKEIELQQVESDEVAAFSQQVQVSLAEHGIEFSEELLSALVLAVPGIESTKVLADRNLQTDLE